jgi:hypothetical protein
VPAKKAIRGTVIAAHLQELLDAGCSVQGMHEASGVGSETIYAVLRGEKNHLKRAQADALMKLKAEKVALSYLCSPVGAARRLKALGRQGFTVKDLNHADGLLPARTHISRIRSGRSTAITRELHDNVKKYYEKHAYDTGPSALASYKARQAGWRAPEWWEDKDIDDPSAEE